MTGESAAPAEMPGVEEIARLLFQRSVYHGYDAETLKREWMRTEGIHRGNARAILALGWCASEMKHALMLIRRQMAPNSKGSVA